MSNIPFTRLDSAGLDLSTRVARSATVAASPAASSETIIASLTVTPAIKVHLGIIVIGFAAYTVGTNGVSVNLKIRRTDASGSTLKATGAVTAVAADLGSGSLCVLDTGPTLPGQVYVLTAIVASGSAETTVSAVELIAIVI